MAIDKIAELTEQKTRAFGEITELMERGQDTWSGEDEARFDTLHKEIEDVDQKAIEARAQAEREAKFEQLQEQRSRTEFVDRTSVGESRAIRDGRVPGMTQEQMSSRAFKAWMAPEQANAKDQWCSAQLGLDYRARGLNLNAFSPQITEGRGRSAQVHDCQGGISYQINKALESRALSVGTTTAGGHTVPDGIMQAMEYALLQFGGMRRVASVSRTGDGRSVPWPSVNDTAQKGEVIAENAASNTQDVTFGQVTTTPLLYSSKYVPVSIQLIQDSNEAIESMLGRLLGERIGRIQADHFADEDAGTGTSSARAVTLDAADASVALAVDNAPTYANLLSIKHACDPAYRAAASWVFSDTVLLACKSILDGNSRPLWQAGMTAGEPNLIDGDPYVVDQSMSTSTTTGKKPIIYGDMSKYKIHDATGMEFRRLDEVGAQSHQVIFLAFMRTDARLLDAGTGPVVYATNP